MRHTTIDPDFEAWKQSVSDLIMKHFGLTLDDLPDMLTRDAFDGEVSPEDFYEDTVIEVIKEEFGSSAIGRS